MTLTPEGGAAIPVSVTTTRKVQGGAAIPVYGYMTAPTDGRPAMGGSAIPVRVLTAADLKQNGGQWTLEGRPHAMPVYTAPAGVQVQGGPALAVYPVNAWPTVPVVPPVTPWYLSGGIALANCVAAYKAKGAASLAASYSNLANPGTNDAVVGVAPTFNAATGWTFDGATQYLVGPTINNGYSVFVQYANLTLTNLTIVAGAYYAVGNYAYLFQYVAAGTVMRVYSGDASGTGDNAPGLVTGNYGFAGKTPYRNGTAEPNAVPAGVGGGSNACYIGGGFVNSGPNLFSALEVRAFALYDTAITAPQAAALAAAMAAL